MLIDCCDPPQHWPPYQIYFIVSLRVENPVDPVDSSKNKRDKKFSKAVRGIEYDK